MKKKRELPQWSLNIPTIQLRDQRKKKILRGNKGYAILAI